MTIIGPAAKALKALAQGITAPVRAVLPPKEPPPPRERPDPWLSNARRVAEVNARVGRDGVARNPANQWIVDAIDDASRGGGGWLRRRLGWLRRRRVGRGG